MEILAQLVMEIKNVKLVVKEIVLIENIGIIKIVSVTLVLLTVLVAKIILIVYLVQQETLDNSILQDVLL